MATLSEEQTVALFEILDVPLDTSVNIVSGMGTLTASEDFSAAGQSAAKTAIDAYIAAMSSGRGTVLIERLDRWIEIGTQTGRIEGGGTGNLSGVTIDYAEERALIAGKVRYIVPFYRWHEKLAREAGPTSVIGFGRL